MNVHLLVLIHGMWGNPAHLAELDRVVRHVKIDVQNAQEHDVQLEVLVAKTNRDESTYDGVDWGGERIAEEVLDEIARLDKEGKAVTRFSITGYSLGGLLARYVIGILHQRKFFDKITPVNFNTIASPHIGLPRYPNFVSRLGQFFGPRLLSRTGEQFYVMDKWSLHGRPLLEVMADPKRVFYEALDLFPHKTIYANAVNDMTVPYVTAAIDAEDPFLQYETNGIEIELDPEYAPIIKSWTLPDVPPPLPKQPVVLSPAWFRSLRDARPMVPPPLQFKFPFNLLIYPALPLLVPVFMSLAIHRLSRESSRSVNRVKLLEAGEDAESATQRLVHVMREMERQMEDAVVDVIEEDPAGEQSMQAASAAENGHATGGVKGKEGRSARKAVATEGRCARKVATGESRSVRKAAAKESRSARKVAAREGRSARKAAAKDVPELTPLQLRLIEQLNTLSGLKKERAFFPLLRSAHATIVCRDVERFEAHREGEGVLRHWADHFVL